ncbi:hypothetical protein DM860_014427 [Cuscuta australis]|uniref:Uncharacterized protein n=1 Tax=Cuscuta australis TaxID=267555 RepID=A0A328DXW7_9ASTE|nr:hypothetical protein DM860_014427 [Cuscuta australis]
MSRSRDDADAGYNNPIGNTSTIEMDASVSPPTTSHKPLHCGASIARSIFIIINPDVDSLIYESDPQDNELDDKGEEDVDKEEDNPLERNQHLYVDPNGPKMLGQRHDIFTSESSRWDHHISSHMVRQAFVCRATRLYNRFTYNQCNVRVVHKKHPNELITYWHKNCSTPCRLPDLCLHPRLGRGTKKSPQPRSRHRLVAEVSPPLEPTHTRHSLSLKDTAATGRGLVRHPLSALRSRAALRSRHRPQIDAAGSRRSTPLVRGDHSR